MYNALLHRLQCRGMVFKNIMAKMENCLYICLYMCIRYVHISYMNFALFVCDAIFPHWTLVHVASHSCSRDETRKTERLNSQGGEEARVSNVCLCSLTNIAWVCVHLVFFGGLKGCKLKMRTQHLSMNKYIPLVSCDSNFKYWHPTNATGIWKTVGKREARLARQCLIA